MAENINISYANLTNEQYQKLLEVEESINALSQDGEVYLLAVKRT